jgi:hypothetical protein
MTTEKRLNSYGTDTVIKTDGEYQERLREHSILVSKMHPTPEDEDYILFLEKILQEYETHNFITSI